MIDLLIFNIDGISRSTLSDEYNKLSSELKVRIDKRQGLAKKQSLAAYSLLREGIKKHFNADDCSVYYDDNGKPFCDKCFINISHSGEFCAACLSDREIGIDIEVLKDIKYRPHYRLFTENENLYVNSSKENISERFLEIWTKKEAIIKCFGEKMADMGKYDVFSPPKNVTLTTEIRNNLVISVCERRI